MKARNVIISLVFVLALLVFIIIKIRNEPKKKLVLNRNPSRIEYTKFALCRMDCHHINAKSIMGIFRNGEVNGPDRIFIKNLALFLQFSA
jgi:hypothetical protein